MACEAQLEVVAEGPLPAGQVEKHRRARVLDLVHRMPQTGHEPAGGAGRLDDLGTAVAQADGAPDERYEELLQRVEALAATVESRATSKETDLMLGKVLLRLDAVTPKWISQIQYAAEDTIKRQAEPIRKSQRALFRAIKLMRESPKDAAEVVAQKLGWTPEAVLAAHKISGPLLPVDGHIDVEALSVMQITLFEHGLLKKKLPLDEHYTREFTPVRV